MKYYVSINKKVRNIKAYRVIKKVNERTNKLSKFVADLVDKYITKKGLE